MKWFYPQDEIGNNFDQFGSMKDTSDFHLVDTSPWEFSGTHDMSHGLFRVKHNFSVLIYRMNKRANGEESERIKLTSYVKY